MEDFDYQFKFILIGSINVGKSALLLQFTEKRFEENMEPTIGIEFAQRQLICRGKQVELQIWDTSG